MNLYRVYLGPKDGDLDYFGKTVEAKDAAEATEKAYKYRLLYWQCAANMFACQFLSTHLMSLAHNRYTCKNN